MAAGGATAYWIWSTQIDDAPARKSHVSPVGPRTATSTLPTEERPAPAPPPKKIADFEVGAAATAFTLRVDGRAEAATILVNATFAEGRGSNSWLVRSADRGASWTSSSLGVAKSEPRVVFDDRGARASIHWAGGPEPARVRWLDGKVESHEVGPATEMPAKVGSIAALIERNEETWLAIASTDGVRSTVRYFPRDGGPVIRRPMPSGQLAAVWSGAAPRVLWHTKSKTGFLQLEQRGIPPPGEDWPAPTTTIVPYTPALELVPTADSSCGRDDPRFAAFVGRGPEKSVLVLARDGELLPYRFSGHSKEVDVLCGACIPGLLERSDDGLRVFLPVRRTLSATKISTDPGFDSKANAMATATCTRGALLTVYVAHGRVFVQRSDPKVAWRFLKPYALSTSPPEGTVEAIGAIGLEQRFVVVWARRTGEQLRLESLMSDDGGATWTN